MINLFYFITVGGGVDWYYCWWWWGWWWWSRWRSGDALFVCIAIPIGAALQTRLQAEVFGTSFARPSWRFILSSDVMQKRPALDLSRFAVLGYLTGFISFRQVSYLIYFDIDYTAYWLFWLVCLIVCLTVWLIVWMIVWFNHWLLFIYLCFQYWKSFTLRLYIRMPYHIYLPIALAIWIRPN